MTNANTAPKTSDPLPTLGSLERDLERDLERARSAYRAALAADRPRVSLRAEQVDHDPRRQPRRRRAPRRLPGAAGRSVGPGRWNPISRAANLFQLGLPCMLR